MKLSFTTFSMQNQTLSQAVELAIAYQMDGIELRGSGNIHISPESSFEYVIRAARMIGQAGLKIPCLTAYTRLFCSTLKEMHCQLEQLFSMIELAEYLNASTVRIFVGTVPEGTTRKSAIEIARVGLKQIADRLVESSVKVVIETHDSAKDGKTLATLLDGIPLNIGVLLDIIHPWEQGEDIEETWKFIGNRIYHVHIKDIARTMPSGQVYCRIGEGLLPVEKDVEFLLSKGYDEYFSLEWEQSVPGAEGVSFEEQMESFLKFMKKKE